MDTLLEVNLTRSKLCLQYNDELLKSHNVNEHNHVDPVAGLAFLPLSAMSETPSSVLKQGYERL